jgi:hypothetical protein
MPTATAPVGRPTGFTKPTGFSKPNGFAKPVKEEKEPTKPGPITLVCCILGLLAMLLVCWKQYEVDQISIRTAKEDDFFFGLPEDRNQGQADAGGEVAEEDVSTEDDSSTEETSDESSDASESSDEETSSEEASSEETPAEETPAEEEPSADAEAEEVPAE